MRFAALAFAALTILVPAGAVADSVLVIVAADNGIYEDPVRTEAERVIAGGGAAIRPFGEVVVEAGLNPAEILRCVDKGPDCMKASAQAAGAETLIVFQLKSETEVPNGPRVVMTAWAFNAKTGERLKGAQRFCESCTKLEVLVGLAGELTAEVFAGVAAAANPDTAVEVYTTPKGATILIDGVEVGPEGQVYKVAPGAHDIEARLDGHGSVTLKINAVASQTHTERLTLVPLGAVDTGDGEGIGWVYKWAALGGGVAATTLGVTWIVVDGPQSEDGPGGVRLRKADERNTLVPGIIATSVGVGLLGLSGYLFYKEMASERAQAAIVPTRGGAVVGVSGRF